MFNEIPQPLLERMQHLESVDARDREDGTPRLQRLRQIPPETGKFIALFAASAPEGAYIEVGTSAGYSTLWLAMACTLTGRKITTFEILEDKIRLARETFKLAGVENVVELVAGDALDYLSNYQDISFCFLDSEKEIYGPAYETVLANMVRGGFLLADNAINHKATIQPLLDRALSDARVDALIVPIGKGVLVCRKI